MTPTIALPPCNGYAGTMKRRFSLTRILLCLILLGLAGLVFTHWPRSSLCQSDGEEMVGFNEANGLFYTTHLTGAGQKLNTYDLATGLRRSSETLALEINWLKDSFRWPIILSDDRRFLIAVSMMRGQAHVFKLPSLTPVPIDYANCHHGFYEHMGFALDGKAILFRTREMESDLIMVHDLDHPDYSEYHIPYPRQFMIRSSASNLSPAHSMHLSADRRYLASSLVGRNSALYDLSDNKENLCTESEKGIARFTPDGQTLVFLPGNRNDDREAVWYKLEKGIWKLFAKRKLELFENEQILQATGDTFVTVRTVHPDYSWLAHLPLWFRNKLNQVLPRERLLVRFWDLATGQPKPECNLDFPQTSKPYPYDRSVASANFAPNFFRSMSRSDIIVASDGSHVAWKHDHTITFWEASPRHSLSCWLTCLSILLIACWVGFPRPAQTLSPTHAAISSAPDAYHPGTPQTHHYPLISPPPAHASHMSGTAPRQSSTNQTG